MSINFDENWLRWAVQIEDEANCDIQAGLNLDQNLEEYIAKTKGHINHEKLMSILHEDLGNILSSEDLEMIADVTQNCVGKKLSSEDLEMIEDVTQNCVRDRLKEKFKSFEVA